MKVFLISPEIAPFSETDITALFSRYIPKNLQEKKHDIRLITPKYPFISDRKFTLREVIRLKEISVEWNSSDKMASIKSGFVPDSKVQVYFLERSDFFSSLDKKIYKSKGSRKALADTDMRFSYFAKASLESLKHLHWEPEIIHCCGWATAMVPILLKTIYKDDPLYKNIKVVFSPFASKDLTTFSVNSLEYANVNLNDDDLKILAVNNKGNFSPTLAGISYSDATIAISSSVSNIDKGLKSNSDFAEAIKKRKSKYKSFSSRFDDKDDYDKLSSSILAAYQKIIE